MKKAATGYRLVPTVGEANAEKAKLIQGPKPENAPNRVLTDLFGHP
jgi:hypothetical protein